MTMTEFVDPTDQEGMIGQMTVDIGGKTVVVASLEDIVRSKEIANRPPDHEALPELRELRDGPPAHDDELYEERDR